MRKKEVLKIINKHIIDFQSKFDDERTLEIIKLLEKIREELEGIK